jgi:predicted PhzF superfamily epimerase YddE/YHI9
MRLPLFHVDAFSDRRFAGNPAAVCPLTAWLDDDTLRLVAAENNLSETAYFVRSVDLYELRWFTPRCEARLCGHATLASAFIIMQFIAKDVGAVRFKTRFSGELSVTHDGDFLAMDFPSSPPWPCPNPPENLIMGLAKTPASVMQVEDNYFAVYDSPIDIVSLYPDLRFLEKLHPAGVAITAPGDDCDFVSRYFAPSYGIPEDPVTGSTHCSLAPYWAQRLGKTRLHARQLSHRGGELWCEVKEKRVVIKGKAVLTLQGEMFF